jgi:hypothetical protein
MKDNAYTLLGHMNKLLELAKLARHAAPEDRVYLERTIELISRALLVVAQAQEAVKRARCQREEADADMEHQWNDLAALLAELQIILGDISR